MSGLEEGPGLYWEGEESSYFSDSGPSKSTEAALLKASPERKREQERGRGQEQKEVQVFSLH